MVDMILDIIDQKEILFKINGEFNDKILNDLFENFKENEKKEIGEAIKEKLKNLN